MKNEYWVVENKDMGSKFIMSTHRADPEDKPIELGDLSRESFSYLGDWQVFMRPNYGIAYRLGTKSGFKDSEGDTIELYLYFTLPVSRRGYSITEDDKTEMGVTLEKAMVSSTMIWSKLPGHENKRFVSIPAEPPKYMLEELQEILMS